MEQEIEENEIKGSEIITAELRIQQNEAKKLFTKIYFISSEIDSIKKQIDDINIKISEEQSQIFGDILFNPYLNNEYKSYIDTLLLKEEDNEELKSKLLLKKLENQEQQALMQSQHLYKQNQDLDMKINQETKKQILQEQKQLSDLVKELKEELKKLNQDIISKEDEQKAETDKISLYVRQLKEIQAKNQNLQKEISIIKKANKASKQK